jgi:uncharacterized protein
MEEIQAAIPGRRAAEVACARCTACCAASQFVHISPDETGALACIPPQLLFPAPNMPEGQKLMGYDEQGRCPMLGACGCSIYEARPRTCRSYDCRIFAAAGVEPADESQAAIARQARRWRFAFDSPEDEVLFAAVRASAAYLGEYAGRLPSEYLPRNAVELAVLAIEIHGVFLKGDPRTGRAAVVRPDAAAVQLAVLQRHGTRGRTDSPEVTA